jgi:ABC-type multidrug transport system fused ATPase/permease subunit
MTTDIQLEEELAQTRLTRNILGRMLVFLRPYLRPVILVLCMELLWVLCVSLGPVIIQRTLDDYIPAANVKMLLAGCLVFAATLVLRWIFGLNEIRINMRAGQGFLNDLRKEIFRHVQTLSMNYFDKTKHGRIIARADRDVDNLEHPFVWGPIILISCLFSLIISSVIMCVYSWRLFIAVILVIPFMALASEIFRRSGIKAYRSVQESLTRVTAYLAENISGVRVVQAFCREALNLDRFRNLTITHKNNVVHASVVWNLYLPVITVLYAVSVVIIIVYGGWMVVHHQFTIGKLSAFIFYSGMFFGPILELSDLYNAMLSGASAAERIFLLLDTRPQITNRKGATALEKCVGEVRFENVYFKYSGNTPWILKNISLTIPAGHSIALVGATGAGKSSIANLITRFYEPQEGTVFIDDKDISLLTMESLYSFMGIVLQENFLFSGTVMENLRYVRPEATDEEIIGTARSLGSHKILEKLSAGYKTEIKERGVGLSQGERQIICFTRAFVANPRILVLDEATSAIDARTEAVIQKALGKLISNRTSVIVAHRLSTIRHTDMIYVIDAGEIVESGKHDELVKKRGRYYEMYQEYLR